MASISDPLASPNSFFDHKLAFRVLPSCLLSLTGFAIVRRDFQYNLTGPSVLHSLTAFAASVVIKPLQQARTLAVAEAIQQSAAP